MFWVQCLCVGVKLDGNPLLSSCVHTVLVPLREQCVLISMGECTAWMYESYLLYRTKQSLAPSKSNCSGTMPVQTWTPLEGRHGQMRLMWTIMNLDFFSQRIIASFLEPHCISVPDEMYLLAVRWRNNFSLVKDYLSRWRKADPYLADLFTCMKHCNLDLYDVPTWTHGKKLPSHN